MGTSVSKRGPKLAWRGLPWLKLSFGPLELMALTWVPLQKDLPSFGEKVSAS